MTTAWKRDEGPKIGVVYLAENSKLGHRIHDAQESWNRLCLFTNLRLVDFEGNVMMLKIFFNLVSVDVVDIEISHREHSPPTFIARSKLAIFRIKDSVQKGEIIRDLLVAVDMKSILGLNDRSLKVRHELKSFGSRVTVRNNSARYRKSMRMGRVSGDLHVYIIPSCTRTSSSSTNAAAISAAISAILIGSHQFHGARKDPLRQKQQLDDFFGALSRPEVSPVAVSRRGAAQNLDSRHENRRCLSLALTCICHANHYLSREECHLP